MIETTLSWDYYEVDVSVLVALPLVEYFGLVAEEQPTPAGRGEEWTVYSDAVELPIPVSGSITDAFSRYARKAAVSFYDPDGDLALEYPLSTPIQIHIDGSLRFGGYISQVTTDDDLVSFDLLAFDFWLRSRSVWYAYTDATISEILEDLVTRYTPLTWDPAAVEITNNDILTRTWKGEPLDTVIEELLGASANEEYGADDHGVFYCRPRDSRRPPRDFVAGEYTDPEFDADARVSVNKVTIYYGQSPSTGAISVQDLAGQAALQAIFGSPRPVVIETIRTYPEIATEDEARSKAEAILRNRTTITTGELTTWGAAAVRPGDVCRVEIPDQQIDTDYRVAQIEYSYPSGETRVRLAENEDGVVDILVELSDEVSRIDARDADPDATVLEVVQLDEPVRIEVDVEIYTRSVPSSMFVFGRALGAETVIGDKRGERTQVI